MPSSLTLRDASSAGLLSSRFDSSGSFQQQGQWSWVDLGKTAVSASLNILARYAAADINPYTIVVGQVIAGSFKFGPEGRKRFEQAIMSLPSMQSMGNIVHFGFGVDSVIRNLATTEEGGCLVTLCAAAAECYQEDQVANIMWELVQCYKTPDSLTPSALQWKALVRACAGSLSTSQFPKIAEHLIGLEQRSRGNDRDRRDIRGCSSPDTIAKALLAIGQVSTGKLVSVSVVGGPDAGWLAALAHWMFDLRIAIWNGQGTLLFTNCDQSAQVQVHVFFGKQTARDRQRDVEVQAKVFHLRDISKVISVREGVTRVSLVCGRVPWSSALYDVFGSYLTRLLGVGRAFGKSFGCAARIFQAVKNCEDRFHGLATSECLSYFASSHGKGFVSFAVKTFPELKVLRPEMDLGLRESAEEALATYEASLANLECACGCKICQEGPTDGAEQGKYCLVLIVETILVTIRSLSGISIAENLDPLLSGLEASYERQVQLHMQVTHKHPELLKAFGKSSFILELGRVTTEGIFAGRHLDIGRLEQAARIFGRGRIERVTLFKGNPISAVSAGGITVFLDALRDVSDDSERIGLCHVMPGHIDMHGRPFPYISDISNFNPEGRDYLSRNGQVGLGDLNSPLDLHNDCGQISLVAMESIDFLQVGLLVKDSNARAVLLGPAQYTLKFLGALGLVQCTENGCSGENDSPLEVKSDSTIVKLDSKGLSALWHYRGNTLSRIVALMRTGRLPGPPGPPDFPGPKPFKAILRTHECLNRCRDTALSWGFESAVILSKGEL